MYRALNGIEGDVEVGVASCEARHGRTKGLEARLGSMNFLEDEVKASHEEGVLVPCLPCHPYPLKDSRNRHVVNRLSVSEIGHRGW